MAGTILWTTDSGYLSSLRSFSLLRSVTSSISSPPSPVLALSLVHECLCDLQLVLSLLFLCTAFLIGTLTVLVLLVK